MANIPGVVRPQDQYINSIGSMLQGSGGGFSAPAVTQPTTQPKPAASKKVTYGNTSATSPKQQFINSLSSGSDSSLGSYKYSDDPTVFGNYKGNPNYGFTSADEFKAAGGNFDTVRTIERANVGIPSTATQNTGLSTATSSTQTPSVAKPDPSAGYKSAYTDYIASLAPTTPNNAVSDARRKYLDFVSSAESGIAGIEGQGRGIPLALVRGEQEKLGKQAEITAKRLQGDVGIAQDEQLAFQDYQQRQQGQAKARLEYEKSLLEGDKPIEVGGNLVRLNPETGKYDTLYNGQQAAKPEIREVNGELVSVSGDGSVTKLYGDKKVPVPSGAAAEFEYLKGLPPEQRAAAQAYFNEDANRRRSIVNVNSGGGGLTPGQVNTTVNQIAGAFDNEPIVREYNTVASTLSALKNAGTSPTDDIQRVYAFAKIADPSSAVKEGEYKTIQDYSTALFKRIGINVSRAFDERGFLTDSARNSMSSTLNNILKAKQTAYDNVSKEYQRQIDDAYAGKPRQLTNYGQPYGTAPSAGSDPLGIR